MPLGLIGPNLLIGACIGGVLGAAGSLMHPDLASDPTLYIVIGMGAAMGAVLNAPLAAILAVIELTQTISHRHAGHAGHRHRDPDQLPACSDQRSAHQTVLRQLQRVVPDDPLNQLLHRTDVTSTMDTRVVRVPSRLQPDDLEPLLEFTPTWCLITAGR